MKTTLTVPFYTPKLIHTRLHSMAKRFGLFLRRPKKIRILPLIKSIFQCIQNQRVTLQDWAREYMALTGIESLSKQAIAKRVNEQHLEFAEAFMKDCFEKAPKEELFEKPPLLKTFKRVLLHDSTHFRLPSEQADSFYGVNIHGKIVVNTKIQLVYDLCADQIIDIKLTDVTKNDQSQAEFIFDSAKRGDLVIRDLGYFSLDVFDQMKIKGVYFLSRYKRPTNIYYTREGEKVDILKALRKRRKLDKYYYLGEKARIKVRVVITPVPKKIY